MEGAQGDVVDFVVKNLVPVTLGNFIGGSVMVGFVQWINHHQRDRHCDSSFPVAVPRSTL